MILEPRLCIRNKLTHKDRIRAAPGSSAAATLAIPLAIAGCRVALAIIPRIAIPLWGFGWFCPQYRRLLVAADRRRLETAGTF